MGRCSIEGDKGPARRESQAYWLAISLGTLLITEVAAGLVIAATGGSFKGSDVMGLAVVIRLLVLLVELLLLLLIVAGVTIDEEEEVDVEEEDAVPGSLVLSDLGDVLDAVEKLCSNGLGS